ncbi:polynucleotide adenylyltransferase PcnB [Hyalangium rubrum]|uniref:Poly(A) polymerase I n=1 Tax=Hyalangium rubrum TaxID=3103134 RepID=A0ABU5GZU4_9BACT|nr:polynucleotide adenylyltransferase PcnB [Hyalangium sp. s54d21]MDY7225370.1 polynucleotide adenylyltransferase PcnB [Hyalangium sp. s54d21]
MTRDSTEIPPAGEPAQPAPDDAREAASSEARTASQTEAEEPMSEVELETQAEPMGLPLPTEPVEEPRAESVEKSPEVLVPEPVPPEGELVAPTTTRTGEPAEIDPRELDPDAMKVVLRLHQHGHQAYLVGGCVRDLLLKRKPKDFDIATSAHPGEVRATFRNCRLIGRRFRLAHVYFKGGKIIEVSTFRANPLEMDASPEEAPSDEGGNGNGNGGDDLLITHDNVFGTAEQDARRRDFTINGLFYDVPEGRVIDYVRGRRDLDEQYIRTIGDPEIRMREDPVRILRAVRFASKLGFDIESRTYAAMEGAVEDLPRCAPARLLEETFRLIRGGVAAPSLKLLAALDALKILLPPVDAYFKQHGREGERIFYAFAEALDRRVAKGEPLDDAILLATLLMPISRAAPPPAESQESGAQPSVAQAIEELLAGFVQSARLPRRIAERCRLLLMAQRTLTGERRRRSVAFRRHPLFNEAMVVFELSVEATGEFRDALQAWKSGDVPPQRPSESSAGEGEGVRKRRRRRRRRGGRSGGAESNGASAESASGGSSEGSSSDSDSDSDDAGDEPESAESSDA